MTIERLSQMSTIILGVSIILIIVGLLTKWIFIVIGAIGLIVFEVMSAYIHEWYVDQSEEKF